MEEQLQGFEIPLGVSKSSSFEKTSKLKVLEAQTKPRDIMQVIKDGDDEGLESILNAKPKEWKLMVPNWFNYLQIVLENISKIQKLQESEPKEELPKGSKEGYDRCLKLLLEYRYDHGEVTSGKSQHILLLRKTVSQEKMEREGREEAEEWDFQGEQKAGLKAGTAAHQPSYQVATVILQHHPVLVFQPWHRGGRSVLHEIATAGAVGVLDVIIKENKDRQCLIKAMSTAFGDQGAGKTPLALAIENGYTDVAERLVSYHPDLANEADILYQIVRSKFLGVVKLLLEKNSNLLIKELEKAMVEAVGTEQLEVVKLLIKKDPELKNKLFGEIGRAGSQKIWEFASKEYSELAKISDTLHIAVEEEQFPLAQSIISTYPKLAARGDKSGHCALYYNRIDGRSDFKNEREEVRSLLVQEIMKEDDPKKIRKLLSEENSQSLESIVRTHNYSSENAETLAEGNDLQSKEICLDLTAFSEDSHDFSLLVEKLQPAQQTQPLESLTPQQNREKRWKGTLLEHFDVEFESTLRYVDFPDLEKLRLRRKKADIPQELRCAHCYDINVQDHNTTQQQEVEIVLEWLRDEKKVQKIIELNVPDSMHEPHTEDTISKAIEKFDVEILNWKRFDLSIDCVSEAAKHVRKLFLYGSGNQAPISHWTGAEGVCQLDQLQEVHILIAENIVGGDCARVYKERAEERLGKLKIDTKGKWKDTFKSGIWTAPNMSENIQENRKFMKVKPVTITKLEPFLKFYVSYQQRRKESVEKEPLPKARDSEAMRNSFMPVKVALIDTGVNKSSFKQIKKGISYVYEKKGICYVNEKKGISYVNEKNNESPWWLAVDPHGTQMAGFICQLDPFCELYIAKAGETRPSHSAAAESIRWAIKQDVDIISMSFAFEETIMEPEDQLQAAISEAYKEGIVLLCSTADQGNNTSKVWPANYPETIPIAACNSYGKLAPWSSKLDAKYFFQGTDVVTETIPYMKSLPEISGSSVATAIAAGVASLILACHRIVYPGLSPNKREEVVLDHFKRMAKDAEDKDGKYVKPWDIFKVLKDMSGAKSTNWLWRTFSYRKWGQPGPEFISFHVKAERLGDWPNK